MQINSSATNITTDIKVCRDFFISLFRKVMEKFDRNGKPIDLYEWAKLFEDPNYKIVKRTRLWWGGLLSTVWLGLDHQYSSHDDARPLIFESMCFTKNGGDMGVQERYSTCEQAEQRHNELAKEYSSLYHAFRSIPISIKQISFIEKMRNIRGR